MSTLQIFTSTALNGSIRDANQPRDSINDAGRVFLKKHNTVLEQSSLVYLTYGASDYIRYAVAKGNGDGILRPASIVADGLATSNPGTSLILPIADCIAAVLHDEVENVLMLSHLGRHNLEQLGGTKSVEYMCEQFGCDPENITVWLSPAAGSENYPLHDFNNQSMHTVTTEQLVAAGVQTSRITRSSIDTTKDTTYFSHSEFKKGNRSKDGRFMVVATMYTM